MKGMFLDRDGVINEVLSKRVKFVNNPSQLYLLDGVGEAIKTFNELGFKVFVVTNQGGIGLGYMTEEALKKVHNKMVEELLAYNAVITEIAYCPHKPNAQCSCRKPKPKLLYNLAVKHHINLSKSYMVGDRCTDIETGTAAKVKTVFVGNREEEHCNPNYKFQDLLSFSNWLAKEMNS